MLKINTTIRQLDISRNNIRSHGSQVLGSMLQTNTQLKVYVVAAWFTF